jgi:hypothetical protein
MTVLLYVKYTIYKRPLSVQALYRKIPVLVVDTGVRGTKQSLAGPIARALTACPSEGRLRRRTKRKRLKVSIDDRVREIHKNRDAKI